MVAPEKNVAELNDWEDSILKEDAGVPSLLDLWWLKVCRFFMCGDVGNKGGAYMENLTDNMARV